VSDSCFTPVPCAMCPVPCVCPVPCAVCHVSCAVCVLCVMCRVICVSYMYGTCVIHDVMCVMCRVPCVVCPLSCVQYRLGPLGFFQNEHLAAEDLQFPAHGERASERVSEQLCTAAAAHTLRESFYHAA
jgi:hypothetical protein